MMKKINKKRVFLFLALLSVSLLASFAARAESGSIISQEAASGETPWAWYIARSAGLLGYLLLWLSVFLGLSIRTPIISRVVKPVYSYNVHCWISLQALFFAFVHGTSLLFDKYINFSFGNVFIPFYPKEVEAIDASFLALGITGFYLMVILVVSSYLKNHLSPAVWRALHSLNVGMLVAVIVHSLYLGTDMKNIVVYGVFISGNVFLAGLFLINIIYRIIVHFKKDETIR